MNRSPRTCSIRPDGMLKLPPREALRAMFQNSMSEAKQNRVMRAAVYSEVLARWPFSLDRVGGTLTGEDEQVP